MNKKFFIQVPFPENDWVYVTDLFNVDNRTVYHTYEEAKLAAKLWKHFRIVDSEGNIVRTKLDE